MGTLIKLWKFLLFILPWTRSKVQDAKEILGYIDEGLELLEKQGSRPLTAARVSLGCLKRSL